MSDGTMIRQSGWGELSAPLTVGASETGRFDDRLSRSSNPQTGTLTGASSEEHVDDQCPIGLVEEEQLYSQTSHRELAEASRSRDKQRTLDEALLELLAEWEQF